MVIWCLFRNKNTPTNRRDRPTDTQKRCTHVFILVPSSFFLSFLPFACSFLVPLSGLKNVLLPHLLLPSLHLPRPHLLLFFSKSYSPFIFPQLLLSLFLPGKRESGETSLFTSSHENREGINDSLHTKQHKDCTK